jgi:excisionase family DNA binding protein
MSGRAELVVAIPDELLERLAEQILERLQRPSSSSGTELQSPWLTFEQACEYLGFSQDSLYKLTAARAIPVRKRLNGQGLRFHRGELDEWMQARYPRLDRLG